MYVIASRKQKSATVGGVFKTKVDAQKYLNDFRIRKPKLASSLRLYVYKVPPKLEAHVKRT